jgi:7-cyano-7-deazaguanine synthase in queuosine biosynthesis
MKLANRNIVLCNGALLPKGYGRKKNDAIIELTHTTENRNIDIKLLDFITRLYHLPARMKDLLEIATYIYAADRSVLRGTIKDVEYNSWARDFHFVFKVRDHTFWCAEKVQNALSSALCFMSGDRGYNFSFEPIPNEFPCSLFDQEEFKLKNESKINIILFSGGLDSLAGTLENLNSNPTEKVCLVSHLSGNPSTKKTLSTLIKMLNTDYDGRIITYPFQCNLKGSRAKEETQRTRSFLYSTIAFALAYAFEQDKFFYYENGITSINYLKREDQINSRASRTTHPKTIGLMQNFFQLVYEKDIKIEHPFLFNTKTDILNVFNKYNKENYINNSVSCSKTFLNKTQTTHCGVCSQCVDRRFASFAAGLCEYDNLGIYNFDFVTESITDRKAKTTIIDYVRLAKHFAEMGIDMFYLEKMNELTEIVDFIEGDDENDKVERVYSLSQKHGGQIEVAIKKMFEKYYSPYNRITHNSLLSLLSHESHFQNQINELIAALCEKLSTAIPVMFQKNQPKNENDFNDKVQALIYSDENDYRREFPNTSFALSRITPDHEFESHDLIIESKYIRNSSTPSVASEGIAADLTKYPSDKHKLFVVYDPFRCISEDKRFKSDFESKGNCTIQIIR